jgi:hypothetical protein
MNFPCSLPSQVHRQRATPRQRRAGIEIHALTMRNPHQNDAAQTGGWRFLDLTTPALDSLHLHAV